MFYYPNGGFAARSALPVKQDPHDWYAWHFTPIANLANILAAGSLLSESTVGAHASITSREIRDLRQVRRVRNASYADAPAVSEHVPFYFASKSPTHFSRQRHRDDIVFLGVNVGDLVDSGYPWCASDGNAAVGTTAFQEGADGLGEFIEFDVMKLRYWGNEYPDAPDRMTQRAAELLVYESVPLELVTVAVARLDDTRDRIASMVSGSRYAHISVVSNPSFFYNTN